MPSPKRFSDSVMALEAMNKAVQAFSQTFSPTGPVLEVGSFYPPGYERLCDRRQFFPGLEYVGCDLRKGCGVDRIEDAQKLSFPDGSFEVVILMEILEHLPKPHLALAEARRVLRDDGLLFLSVPFNYRLHGFPHDYRRLTASGMYEVLCDFPQKFVFAIGPRVKPATVFGVATRSHGMEFPAAQKRFQSALQAEEKGMRRRLFWAAFQDRVRDLVGLLTGRADVSVAFYDPASGGGYEFEAAPKK